MSAERNCWNKNTHTKLNRHEKWFEKREQGSEKRSETCPKNLKPLSRRLHISHRHASRCFSPPKICTNKNLFTPRGCRDSHGKKIFGGNLSCNTLSFLSLFFWKKARKTTKKTRIFYPNRTPEIPGKEGKNARKNKEFLAGEKNKEFQKNKERKVL